MRRLLPRRVARRLGSAHRAKSSLMATVRRGKREQRLWDDFKRRQAELAAKPPPIEPEVVDGSAYRASTPDEPPQQTVDAQEVIYFLPAGDEVEVRRAVVSWDGDGTLWCLIALMPWDHQWLSAIPNDEEVVNSMGQRTIRRGWGLAIADVKQGTAPGTYQPKG